MGRLSIGADNNRQGVKLLHEPEDLDVGPRAAHVVSAHAIHLSWLYIYHHLSVRFLAVSEAQNVYPEGAMTGSRSGAILY